MSPFRATAFFPALVLVGAVASLLTITDTSSPEYVLASGLTVSLLTYFLVSWLPEKRRRKRIKHLLAKQYDSFKEECISIFFSALGKSYSLEEQERLKNQAEFIHYFQEDLGDGDNRWYRVLNGLNERLISQLLSAIDMLVVEISYALNMLDIDDDEVFRFLKRLSHVAHSYQNFDDNYDDVKRLSGFLWTVHTGWSVIDGYTDRDVIQEMIERI